MTTAVSTARAELLRALGAAILSPPPHSDVLFDALGLPRLSGASYTDAFVLTAPPHAAIHLGPEGKLGGEGADRVDGFWRALGVDPPSDGDHLGVLLLALAQFADAAGTAVAATFFHEHVWSWAPGYLAAVGDGEVGEWSALTLDALRAEYHRYDAPAALPLALRAAPPPIDSGVALDQLLDAMVAPVRTGVVLTRADVLAAARRLGIGYRRGERRFALSAMLEQDKPATLEWFATTAQEWATVHTEVYGDSAVGRWWAARARATAEVVGGLAVAARG